MKTILVTFAALLLMCSINAQQKFKHSTYIGINASGNLCSVNFEPTVSQKLFITPTFGLIFRHVSEPHIGTQLELNYAGRGWFENRDSLGTYKRNLQVLDIPLTASFIAGSKRLRIALNLGPYVSKLLSDHETISIIDTADYYDYYGKKLANRWEFGFIGGLSIETYTKLGAFGIRAAYSHALSNLFPLNTDKFYYGGSRTQTITAGFTYFIEL